jgi:hypothetical protein
MKEKTYLQVPANQSFMVHQYKKEAEHDEEEFR